MTPKIPHKDARKSAALPPESTARVRPEPIRRRAFLAAYAKTGNVSLAAKACRIPRQRHYEWMKDPEYAAAAKEAHIEACELVEAEIFRRGVTGVLKPVFYQGVRCSTVREYSDILLMFKAKKLMPEYRDNFKIEHSGTLNLGERLLAARARMEALGKS